MTTVRNRTPRSEYQRPQRPAEHSPFDLTQLPIPPRQALARDVAVRARTMGRIDREGNEEWTLRTLHQYLLAGVPKDQIAQEFGVTPRTIYNWEERLRDRFAQEAKTIDPHHFLGEALEFYRVMQRLGMGMALTGKTLNEKRTGQERALQAHNDMIRFLQVSKFFDRIGFDVETRPEDKASQDADVIKGNVAGLLAAYETRDALTIEGQVDESD